jgi:hypothetical protein
MLLIIEEFYPMHNAISDNHKKIIRNYVRAKDDSKPYFMESVFCSSAILSMKVNSKNISFPADTLGLDEITNVLVRTFSENYENVFTFCLMDSVRDKGDLLSCDWLVAMSEKGSGDLRVGCGKYDWEFSQAANSLVSRLTITIEQMVVLSPDHTGQIMGWLEELPYPFCVSTEMLDEMPAMDFLQPVREYLK